MLKNDVATARALLLWGADPNTRRDRKDRFRGPLKMVFDRIGPPGSITPLMFAAMQDSRDNGEMVSLLLERGAQVDATGWLGGAPLTLAIDRDRPELVRELLRHGADINQSRFLGRTPLTVAVDRSRKRADVLGMVNLLLDAGAGINAHGPGGESALMAAAQVGDAKAVRLLIDHGANVNDGDDQGENAIGRAQRAGHREIVKMLLDAGANWGEAAPLQPNGSSPSERGGTP